MSLLPVVSFPAWCKLLPAVATVTGFWKVAAAAGAVCVFAQLALQWLFGISSDPILSKSPGNTAHSAVAAAFCIVATAIGWIGFYSPLKAATAVGRVLDPVGAAAFIGAAVFGAIALWDIPTCLAIKELRKPDFILHHVGMAAVGGFGAYYAPSVYGLFYLGVIELSSIPLSVYEGASQVGPKADPRPYTIALTRALTLDLHALASQAYDIASDSDECAPERCGRLMKLRDTSQTIATFGFMIMRLYLFSRVTFFQWWPDAFSVLPTMAAGGARNTVRFLVVAAGGFAALQTFWFGQIIQQIFIAKWFAPKDADGAEPA